MSGPAVPALQVYVERRESAAALSAAELGLPTGARDPGTPGTALAATRARPRQLPPRGTGQHGDAARRLSVAAASSARRSARVAGGAGPRRSAAFLRGAAARAASAGTRG